MAITINGSGTITGISAGGLPDGVITSADLASGAITSAGLPAGSILQAVTTTKTDTFTTTSSSLTDITGLSASITPASTSNKILIIAYINGTVSTSTGSYGGRLQLVRGTTNIAQGDSAGSRQVGTGHLGGQDSWPFAQTTTITFLDSPSTTSSTTYKIQCAHTQSKTIRINTSNNDSDSSTYALRMISSITLLEVAA